MLSLSRASRDTCYSKSDVKKLWMKSAVLRSDTVASGSLVVAPIEAVRNVVSISVVCIRILAKISEVYEDRNRHESYFLRWIKTFHINMVVVNVRRCQELKHTRHFLGDRPYLLSLSIFRRKVYLSAGAAG